MITITLNRTKVSRGTNPNSRKYWKAKIKPNQIDREQARIATLAAVREYFTQEKVVQGPIKLVCNRYYSGHSKPLDPDNLAASLKPFIDGIASALGMNDRDFTMEFKQFVCTRDHYLLFYIYEGWEWERPVFDNFERVDPAGLGKEWIGFKERNFKVE